MRSISLSVLVAVCFSLVGCAHKQLSSGSLRDVQKLAVVVRVASPAKVDSNLSGDVNRQIQEVFAKQVSVFEMEERVRTALFSRLPQVPPWSTAMSPAEVATLLQSLLVVDHSAPIDYGALERAGADAVLELQVEEWGVANIKKNNSLFMKGDGRLFRLPGGSKIWADSLDTNLAHDPDAAEMTDAMLARKTGFREGVMELVSHMAERIAPELSGEEK